MGDGSFAPVGVSKQRADQYKGRLTTYVVVACLVAAVGGAIFGYDIGVSGTSLFLHQSCKIFQFAFCNDEGIRVKWKKISREWNFLPLGMDNSLVYTTFQMEYWASHISEEWNQNYKELFLLTFGWQVWRRLKFETRWVISP